MTTSDLLTGMIRRMLKGAGSADDRRGVERAVHDGAILVDTSGSVTVGGDNAGIIVTGDGNRITVQLDEESYARLQASVFPAPPGVPPPPSAFLFFGRERDVAHLKEALAYGDAVSRQRTVVVDGWPGVGKSTLATVLGRDSDTTQSFPDGVYWAVLGQDPNLIRLLSVWGTSLGLEDLFRVPTADEIVPRLQSVLRARKILFILDDVWSVDDVRPFLRIAGPSSSTLITTRQEGVSQGFTAASVLHHRLRVLEEDDAMRVLCALAPDVVESASDECRKLVCELERLPLAIHVAGRLLRQEARFGWGVGELLEDIRRGSAILNAKAPDDVSVRGNIPTVSALLARSTDLLDDQTRHYFACLGFLAAKPTTFDLETMQALWDEPDPKPFVRNLVSHGLIEPMLDGRFQMHALLVAHAKSILRAAAD